MLNIMNKLNSTAGLVLLDHYLLLLDHCWYF